MQKWQTYPRSMKEAFGPYTDDTLYDKPMPSPWSVDDLVGAICAVGVILFFVIVGVSA